MLRFVLGLLLLVTGAHGVQFIDDDIWNSTELQSYERCKKEFQDKSRYDPEDEMDAIEDAEKATFKKGGRRFKEVYYWPNGRVPYEIDYNIDSWRKKRIACAFLFFKEKTCVRFVPRSHHDRNYIHITKTEKKCSSSNIGMGKGQQFVKLGDQCWFKVAMIHELMHAIGFFHEQSRDDRDKYITVNWNNIPTQMQRQFKTTTQLGYHAVTLFGKYDYKSVMHYTRRSKRGKPTMTAKRQPIGENNKAMGNRKAPTKQDIYKINKMYQCFGLLLFVTSAHGAQFIDDEVWNSTELQSYEKCKREFVRDKSYEPEAEIDDIVDAEKGTFKKAGLKKVYSWPNGRVPYEIGDNIGSWAKKSIACAMLFFKEHTCVRFVPRCNHDPNYIHYMKRKMEKKRCSSSKIGMGNGQQVVTLGGNCTFQVAMIHVMMHMIGFFHEQSRDDRDKYITVNWKNIDKKMRKQYKTTRELRYNLTLFGEYDYKSVMHYPRKSKSGKAMMTAKRILEFWIGANIMAFLHLIVFSVRQMIKRRKPTTGTMLEETEKLKRKINDEIILLTKLIREAKATKGKS